MAFPSSSAQAQLRVLANRLRELRIDTGLTGVALANVLGWHRTKVSRIEHGTRPPSIRDVRAWCHATGADDQAEDLVEALRVVEGAYVQWQRLQRTGLRRLQDSYVPLYERTRLLHVYSSLVVPGLLQTPRYITALLTAIAQRQIARNDVEAAVEARLARRRALREGDHRFAFVLEEAVFTYALGDPPAMAEQLRHLLSVMSLPTVSLGVIPAGTKREQWPLETFVVYDREQVEVELLSARVTITAPSETRLYVKAFEEFARIAVYGDLAREIIEAAATGFAS